MEQHTSVTAPVFKITTAWFAFAFTSWAEVAQALAALYTACLVLEWFYNKLVKPWFAKRRKK